MDSNENNTNINKDEKNISQLVANFHQYPIDILSDESKDKLKLLDCCYVVHDDEFARKDFRGLAMLVGYDVLGLNYLIDHRGIISPTLMILEKMRKENKTLGHLILYMRQLGRFEVLSHVKTSIIKDIKMYKEKSRPNKTHKMHKEGIPKILQAESTTPVSAKYNGCGIGYEDENYKNVGEFVTEKESMSARNSINQYFTTDIIDNKPQNTNLKSIKNQPIKFEEKTRPIKIYDVFISFDSESDFDVRMMLELSEHLEKAEITVAKGSYSFFQGVCLTEAYAQAIYSRCRKVILLLSDSYVQSETCLMQLNFARDSDKALWHRKVIPVYIQQIKSIPPIIANINGFKYYDKFCKEHYLSTFVKQMKM